MQPKIVNFDHVKVAGLLHKTSHSNNTIPAFWEAVFADGRHDNLHKQDWAASHNDFGVCLGDAANPDAMDYVLGLAVKDGCAVPDEFYQVELTSGQYAMLAAPMEEIGAAWGKIYAWLNENNEYEADHSGCAFELYKCDCANGVECEACKTGTMVCEIYTAVKPM